MVKKIEVGEEKKTVLVTDKTTKYVKSNILRVWGNAVVVWVPHRVKRLAALP